MPCRMRQDLERLAKQSKALSFVELAGVSYQLCQLLILIAKRSGERLNNVAAAPHRLSVLASQHGRFRFPQMARGLVKGRAKAVEKWNLQEHQLRVAELAEHLDPAGLIDFERLSAIVVVNGPTRVGDR